MDTEKPGATEGDAQDGAGKAAKGQRTFGGMSPQEAGRKGAQERERRRLLSEQAAAAESSGKVVLLRVPVPIGNIVARLSADAAKGNVQAARELRGYLDAYPAEDETDVSALDRRTRQGLMARLLADLAEADGQVGTQVETSVLDEVQMDIGPGNSAQ